MTGLTAAHYLTKLAPNIPITIYESTGRLGGWVKTNVARGPNGYINFEAGPRNIRPMTTNALVTLDIVCYLEL